MFKFAVGICAEPFRIATPLAAFAAAVDPVPPLAVASGNVIEVDPVPP